MSETLLIGIGVVILMTVLGLVGYKSWEDRRKSNDFLLDTIIAFKVGVIEKKAKDNGVELTYPKQRDEFIDKIEAELERDLNMVG